MKNIQLKLSLIAAFLIFMGFGMIHGNKPMIENTGSILIGIGCVYFLYRLIFVKKQESIEEEKEQ